ncbi:MAG TPA: crotonase/enoyl-CoA hydratase family protein [Ramlibacter sp.]|uniref:crotonase/enoyl-CoA hydratase family protein n=1 Tax=Ramlibacter sp. TaxID=1917967 RepID=UPI002BEC7B73|nr:crotonase/enoyl-CoA hydratase family protein [Ramlibacter sp.]HVZ44244.1 crotonase/enoyl-CoA hydratase family protein [Ramlibacter sp.]
MTEPCVLTEFADGIAHVRLHRPAKLNALDGAMFAQLVDAGERLHARNDVRCIVLSGAGNSFCAGLDASLFAAMAGDRAAGIGAVTGNAPLQARTHGIANRAQRMATVWADAPVPVIAAVHGHCFGGGLQIALGADIRIVAPDARMSAMEVRWGLVPDMAGMIFGRRLLRADVFAELVYTGRQVSGEEAVRIGLATRVAADPLAEATALAKDIAQRSPDAIRAAKRLLGQARVCDDATLLLQESLEQERLIGSANQLEAVRANIEKRAPAFRD